MKSIDQANPTIPNSNSVGGKQARPIGCTFRKNQALDFFVTKTPENLHHSDWVENRNFGHASEWGERRDKGD